MPENQRTLFDAGRFAVVEETVLRPDGRSASVKYIRHPGSVAILPILSDDRVCLIRNRRITIHKTILEIPAGTREPNEAPIDTARRELTEETGYSAAELHELTTFYPSPGISDEQMWIYVARELTPGDHAREPNEEIENHVVTLDEAREMVSRREIEDCKTILALLLLHRQARS